MRLSARLVVVSAAIIVTGLSMVPSSAAPASGGTPSAEDYFTEEDLARARAYRGPRYALGFTSLGIALVVAALMGFGPGTRRLGEWTSGISSRPLVQAAILAVVVTSLPTLVTLPLAFARWRLDRSYGLATNTAVGFLGDLAKGAAFSVAVAAIAAVGFVAIARWLPRGWPAVVGAGAAVLTVALVYLFPVVYEPAFNRFTPAPADVRARLVAIADRAGVRVDDVLVADASRRTTRQNAYVSGLGPTKRIVLYDTLLERSTPDQVDLVVAHELGHVKHRDVLRGTLLSFVGIAFGVLALWWLLSRPGLREWIGITSAGDPRVVPFLAFAFALATLLTAPIANGYSRAIEASADRAALELTHDPATAIEVEVSLARSNIADLDPNPFIRWAFFTHPPAMERIGAAIEFARARGITLPSAQQPG